MVDSQFLCENPISLPISVTCSFFMRSGSGFSLYLFCPGTGWSFSVMEFHEHPTNVVSRIVRTVLGSQASINDTLHWETIQHFHFNLVRTDRNCVIIDQQALNLNDMSWFCHIFTGVWLQFWHVLGLCRCLHPSGAIFSLYPQDVKDDYGWTVLMWASLAGSIDICDAWTGYFFRVVILLRYFSWEYKHLYNIGYIYVYIYITHTHIYIYAEIMRYTGD